MNLCPLANPSGGMRFSVGLDLVWCVNRWHQILHELILAIVDFAARYLEAVPLRQTIFAAMEMLLLLSYCMRECTSCISWLMVNFCKLCLTVKGRYQPWLCSWLCVDGRNLQKDSHHCNAAKWRNILNENLKLPVHWHYSTIWQSLRGSAEMIGRKLPNLSVHSLSHHTQNNWGCNCSQKNFKKYLSVWYFSFLFLFIYFYIYTF